MPYNAALKQSSIIKQTMNTFIASCVLPTSKAIVIDAETLQSSRALVSHGGLTPANVVVLNDKKDVIAAAVNHGHIHSLVGISTDSLRQLHDRYDCIYLDFCGTPERSQGTGWNPELDILLAADKLNKDGICIATFTKGHCANAVIRATNMKPDSLQLVREIHYRETSPMYSMILAKTNDCNYVQTLQRRYNTIALQVQETEKKTKSGTLPLPRTSVKKRCKKRPLPYSSREEYDRLDVANGRKRKKNGARVVVTWKHDTRPKTKQYVGKTFKGNVLRRGKKGWIVKWDEGGTTDIEHSWIQWA